MLRRFLAFFATAATATESVASSGAREITIPYSKMSEQDRIMGALIGFYIGDALAMPVHWYYNVDQLKADFGKISKYEAPKPRFRGSIMNLSNTGGGGRGSDKGEIVGSVILHGKKQFWLRGGDYHYHHGMLAGENTLDALITRVLTQSMLRTKSLDPADFRTAYINFMTTPGTHNDTYAGTCHRMFFKNLIEGRKPEDCPDNDSHNVDAIDALMILPPVVIATMDATPTLRALALKTAIQVTRDSNAVLRAANIYAEMLIDVLKGTSIPEAAQAAGLKMNYDVATDVRRNSGRADPMTACYITSSFPVMLFFAYKYGNDPEQMLLASTNAGGENVARGSLLGALAGARLGLEGLPAHLRDDLVLSEALKTEAAAFVDTFRLPDASAAAGAPQEGGAAATASSAASSSSSSVAAKVGQQQASPAEECSVPSASVVGSAVSS